jgi:hypothetical protein
MDDNNPVVQILLSILLFPILFQGPALGFCWGVEDPFWIMVLKRLFLMLPLLAFIAACWITIVSLFTVIFRPNRMPFLVSLIITWWDLAKSFMLFWAGIFRFVFELFLVLLGLFRILLMTLWSIVVDIVFFPFKVLAVAFRGIMDASVPWIAVTLTLFWCLIEALIFPTSQRPGYRCPVRGHDPVYSNSPSRSRCSYFSSSSCCQLPCCRACLKLRKEEGRLSSG